MEKDRRGTLICLLLLLVRFTVPVQAKQELSTLGATKSDVTVYWGQNSYGQSTGPLAQQPLATYCENADIDIIPMAFLYQLTTGQGGQPVINLSNIQNNCSMFPGTGLINCPDIGEDIKTCQKKGKKILISIGGATYTEGGFPTADKAVEAAKQIWAVFGPPGQTEAGLTSMTTSTSSTGSMTSSSSSSSTAALGLTSSTTGSTTSTSSSSTSAAALAALTSSKIWWTPSTTALTALESSTIWWTPSTSAAALATSPLRSAAPAVAKRDASALRPFGDAVIDGFDFDFESTVTNIIPFATQLRALMDADSSKPYFLTAAPQCPFPDAADSQVLNSEVKFDAIWVQFYNNACGLQSFVPTGDSNASAAIAASSSSSSSTSSTSISSTSTSTASSLLPSTTSSSTSSSSTTSSTATSTPKAQPNFNFAQWDTWAKTQSANKNVKVFLGVPADTTAAGTGYMATTGLQPIIDYAKTFDSFGGVMMWDASQAYANTGFLAGVRSALGGSGASAAAGELAGESGQAPAAGSQGQGQIGSVAAVPATQQGFIQARGIHEKGGHGEVVARVAKFGYAAQGHIREHLRHGAEVGVKSGRHGMRGVRWQA